MSADVVYHHHIARTQNTDKSAECGLAIAKNPEELSGIGMEPVPQVLLHWLQVLSCQLHPEMA